MSTSVSSVSNGDIVFSLTFDVGLTICFARVCFSSSADGINFWHLTDGSVVL